MDAAVIPSSCLQAHKTEVNAVVHSPDGKWIASGASSEPLKLWDAADGTLLLELGKSADTIFCISFAASAPYVASVIECEQVNTFEGHGIGMWRRVAATIKFVCGRFTHLHQKTQRVHS